MSSTTCFQRSPILGSRPSLHTVAGAFLDGVGTDFLRGSGLQRSDAIRFCLKLCRRHWDVSLGLVPRERAPLSREASASAAEILRTSRVLVEETLDAAVDVIASVERALSAEIPPRWRRTDYGERVLSRVGTMAAEDGAPPSGAARSQVVDEVVHWLDRRVTPLPAPDFGDRYAAAYERMWREVGAANLRAHPPSRIELGSDEPAPLVASRHQASGRNWLVGTDRSIYDRYRPHFKDSAHSRPHQAGTPAAPPDFAGDLAELEIWRACQPYGLMHRQHQLALRVLFMAVTLSDHTASPASNRQRWRDWSMADAELGAQWLDETMLSAVGDYLRFWRAHKPAGRSAAERFGGFDVRLADLARAAVRKLWMELFRWERENAEPIRSRQLAASILTTLDQGVREGLTAWPRDVPPPEPEDRRVNATLVLLRRHAWLAQAMLSGLADHAWETSYVQGAQADVGCAWTQAYLSVEEVRAYLRRHVDVEDAR